MVTVGYLGPPGTFGEQAALLFDVIRHQQSAGVWKQSFLQPAKKHQWELQSFGSVQGHQRDLRAGVVLVGITD